MGMFSMPHYPTHCERPAGVAFMSFSVIIDAETIDAELPDVELLDPDQEFLPQLGFPVTPSSMESESALTERKTPLARLLPIDGQTVLLSTSGVASAPSEQSVCAAGETNGLIVLARNLLTSIETI